VRYQVPYLMGYLFSSTYLRRLIMLTVANIMTTEVFTIRSSAKVTQAIALMQEKQVRSLIVER